MTREKFEAVVLEQYNIRADYPFEDDFETGVFRHESGKWFALAMRISAKKLGKQSDMSINVVNFKCAPEVIDSIAGVEPGIYRAYHMNKIHWLSVCLEECDDDTISQLLGISYDLTKNPKKFDIN